MTPTYTRRPEATIVIASQTPPEELRSCLAAAAYQKTSRQYEIVVMHSGYSLAGSGIDRIPRVAVREVDDRLLPAAKKNLAVRTIEADWVVFLDSDCIAAPNWLETLLSTAERHDAAGVSASVDIGQPKNAVTWPIHMLEYGRWLPAAKSGASDDFCTCGAAYRREDFLAVGGFPEDVFPCCDTILNAKLRAHGARLWFTTATSVAHQQFDGRDKLLCKSDRYGRAYAIAANRYRLPGHRLRGPACIPLVFAGRLGRMVGRALIYRPFAELPYLLRSAPYAIRNTFVWSVGVATGPVDAAHQPAGR